MSTPSIPPPRRILFGRLPLGERTFVADALRQETVGGALLLVSALAGLVIANSLWADAYERLKDFVVGPSALHLNLSLQTWASDGLLAIFFFVAGLELKRELVVGTLRERSQAVLPVVAAFCGMAVPALVFLAITAGDPSARTGWAIPMATDIAFALAVLAVVGSHLPPALRAFLLTLAVVDDLGAIAVIAAFFTDYLRLVPLLVAGLLLVGYYLLQKRRVATRWIYFPLALVIWTLIHDSGIHATVAGIAMGLLTRVRPDADEDHSPAERLEHRIRPVSAGIAVPIFAFLAAGVHMDIGDLKAWSHEPLLFAVMGGMVIGKLVGVFGGTYLAARFTKAELDPSLKWVDMVGLSLVSGVGFTVSLLIADLAFDTSAAQLDIAKVGVLFGSLVAAFGAGIILTIRDRPYRVAADRPEDAT